MRAAAHGGIALLFQSTRLVAAVADIGRSATCVWAIPDQREFRRHNRPFPVVRQSPQRKRRGILRISRYLLMTGWSSPSSYCKAYARGS